LDLNTGEFIYYGDNKIPGHELHDTPRKGNLILRNVFDWLHASPAMRNSIPPFFVFSKFPTSRSSRSVQFNGLAVPGSSSVSATDDLIAVWKTTNQQRFQNYRATFTILNIPKIERAWLKDLNQGLGDTPNAPSVWRCWRTSGKYHPLISAPTTIIRSITAQLPQTELQEKIIDAIYKYFQKTPSKFEAFSAKVFQLHDSKVIIDEITRAAVDGGRDAVGRYLLGLNEDPVFVEFSLEAKCYRPVTRKSKGVTVGVKDVSRLISRLKHRQFGVLVTTSVIAKQSYEEVRDDKHPVIFICGKDISEILIRNGFNSPEAVLDLLGKEFPL